MAARAPGQFLKNERLASPRCGRTPGVISAASRLQRQAGASPAMMKIVIKIILRLILYFVYYFHRMCSQASTLAFRSWGPWD